MNISSISPLMNCQTQPPCRLKCAVNSDARNEKRLETSIYNSKGTNVYFGSLARAQDAFEAECIQILRKVREHRCRKFDEFDITEMLGSLRKEQNPENKTNVLKEIFSLECEEAGKSPDRKFLKRVLNLTSGRPEDERFAILEFAQNELNIATKPLETFAALPAEKQDKLVKLLKDINNVNDTSWHGGVVSEYYNSDSLYDSFRTLVYAEDDIAKLGTDAANTRKVDAYHILKDDMEYYKNSTYPDENVKRRVLSAAENIYEYFLENVL